MSSGIWCAVEALEGRRLFDLAPDSVVGYTFDMTIQSATAPFADHGTYELRLGNVGNYYLIKGDGKDVAGSSGTYTYTKDSASTGHFVFNDNFIGPGTGEFEFDTSKKGTFALSASGGTQTSSFVVSGTGVPDFTDLVGSTLVIQGTGGRDISSVEPYVNDPNVLFVQQNGHSKTYPMSAVSLISVDLGGGNDSFDAFGPISIPIYVLGGPGNDLIIGGDGNDTLTGSGGNNTIYGGAGNDRLNGGGSSDSLRGDTGNDRLYGSAGDDNLSGGDQADHIWGGDGNDAISGGSSNDYLYGENGNDTLSGGKQNDIIDGGANADAITGDDGNDTLYGGGGNDRLTGGPGNDSLRGGAGNDVLFAKDNAIDTLKGDSGTDSAQFDLLDSRESIELTLA